MKFDSKNIRNLVLTTAIVAVAMPTLAFAQADLATSVTQVQGGISKIPQIVAGLFYIGGAALVGSGALFLKKHSENPGQTSINAGLGRVVAGSALIAIPAFSSWLNTSLNIGAGTVTEGTLGTVQ